MADTEEPAQQIFDEIKVLNAIFCKTDEFLINEGIPENDIEKLCRDLIEGKIQNIRLSVKLSEFEHALNDDTRLLIYIDNAYPNELKGISVSSDLLTRKQTQEIRLETLEYAKENLSQLQEPFILKLVQWAQTKYTQISLESQHNDLKVNSENVENSDLKICILKFDHMRSRKKYLKRMSNWMKELDVNGCVTFFERHIFAIIEGNSCDIHKYLKRLRTCSVDVDSSGQACKERMMDVICEINTKRVRYLMVNNEFHLFEYGIKYKYAYI